MSDTGKTPSARTRTRAVIKCLGAVAWQSAPFSRAGGCVVAVRTALCMAALLAISYFIGETGHATYTNLNYPVLIYAGLTLPWPVALSLTAVAAVGPNVHGSVMVTAFRDDNNTVVRPITMIVVSAIAIGLSRAAYSGQAAVRHSERRLFSFLDSMPVAVSVLDAAGHYYFVNSLSRRLTGRGADDSIPVNALGETFQAYLAGTDEIYPESRMPIVRALAGETSMADDMVLRRPDGDMNVQVWGAPIRDEAGKVTHAVAAFSNVTAQKRFEQALVESESRFRTVFEEGPLGMAIVSHDSNKFLQVNQALCNMTGYRGDELVGMTFLDITHPEDRELHRRPYEVLERGEIDVLDIEKRYVRKDGALVWVRVCVRIVRNDGQPAYQLLMVQDISEQRRAQALIEHMAYADPLTDLPNRRLMYDRLAQAIVRSKRYGGGVIVLSVDLDGFKHVNDRHGHIAGDAVLVEVANRLRACVRDSDTVARMGGDEFLVLLTESSTADAIMVRHRIAGSLSEPVYYEGEALEVPPSIGIASLGVDGDDADALINAADEAMYVDKARHSLARVS